MMDWTKAHCEHAALEEHARVIGHVVEVNHIDYCKDGQTLSHMSARAIPVKVLATPAEVLVYWVEDYLDPQWYVEPLETLPGATAEAFWIYGPSWRIGKGSVSDVWKAA
jgi:hypothetical protein